MNPSTAIMTIDTFNILRLPSTQVDLLAGIHIDARLINAIANGEERDRR